MYSDYLEFLEHPAADAIIGLPVDLLAEPQRMLPGSYEPHRDGGEQ